MRYSAAMADGTVSHTTVNAPWPIILAVIGVMSVFTITLGLSYPLLALILQNIGTPKALIGLNAAMTPMGIIVSAPLFPRLAGTRSSWGLAMLCLTATLLIFIMIGATRRLALWFVLRFLLGASINGLYIISETWINQLSHAKSRGRVMGIYATVMSLGFCIGPFILPLTGFEGWPPFLVGIACFIAAGLLLLPLRDRMPEFGGQTFSGSLLRFIRLAPVMSLAVLIAAYFDQVVLSFLPLFALAHGLSSATASFALGVLIVGNVFLQIPLGWLADRTSRHKVMLLCAVTTLFGSALLPLVIRCPGLLWPMLFIWGGAAFGVYTAALAELGDRFSGAMLLTGSAAFGLMWGVGGIAGPASVGLLAQFLGMAVFPFSLGIPFGLFVLMLIWPHHGIQKPAG